MEAMLAEIKKMQGPGGFDFVIVCCSNLAAENFWQKRLESTIKEVIGSKATVLCVHEDWNGGAGNGLGTLYAFQKAAAKRAAMGGPGLAKAMRDGCSVAIYHTAGKGTRMAPLPGAENNNKPGVKLPGLLTCGDALVPITVLEAVLRQTSSYASVRGGRCSVFWGDQIFVPSCGIRACDAPADILAALRPMPTEQQWKDEELHQYGLIAVDPRGAATQLEKVTYDVAKQYLPSDVQQVGTSLGSFSLSAGLMDALMEEFSKELAEKTACLDSDPHFWMPFTLKETDYVAVMAKKDMTADEAGAHYARMKAFREKFLPSGGPMLGCVDVGQDTYWWDFGRLGLYYDNNVLLTDSSDSAHAFRTFMYLHADGAPREDTSGRKKGNQLADSVTIDPTAIVVNCKLGGGTVGPKCVLVNVTAPSIEAKESVLMCVSSSVPVSCSGAVLYNVVEDTEASLVCNGVRADVFMPGGQHHKMKSALSIDGGKAWKEVVEGNPMSFEGIYKANGVLDVAECSAEAQKVHKAVSSKVA